MANGFKTGGKDFEPGESGNSNGRPPVPEDLRDARKLNKIEFERVLNEYIYLPIDEIKDRAEAPITAALEVLVAKILIAGINSGDERRLNFILDRLIGPVKIIIKLEDVPDSEFIAEAKRRFNVIPGGA